MTWDDRVRRVRRARHLVQIALVGALVGVVLNVYAQRWVDVAIMGTGWVMCFGGYLFGRHYERSLTG